MVEKIKINETGDCIYTEQDAIDLLYSNPELDISTLFFENPKQYNISIMDTGLPLKKLETVPSRPSPKVFDEDMINNWYMPEKYYQVNVKDYLLDKCQTQEERDRVELEYVLFEKKKFIRVLQFLIYFIDTLREKNVVWGVGRGSSVASFCLFLIGVHKINPLQYKLNIAEFLR
jgi:DNA polymerase III alpha subunit|tara:strand:+ start:68 stop:589 length:522 start_codon:yes stop_codon:yes gene_type:complete